MDTFPAIEPVYSVAEEVNPLVKKNAFGDGYLQSIRFGLNFIKPDWNLQWLVSKAEASTIELFLKQQSEDGKWFYWTPPDSSSAVKWRCDEWTIEDLADSLVRVDANFRQVFELILNEQIAEEYLCPGTPGLPGDIVYGSPLTLTGCAANDLTQWYSIAPDGITTEAISGATGCTYTPPATLIGYQVYAVSNGIQTNSTTVRGITPYFSQACNPPIYATVGIATFGEYSIRNCTTGVVRSFISPAYSVSYGNYTNLKKIYTYTSLSDGTAGPPVWYQTTGCAGSPGIRRNGLSAWVRCGFTNATSDDLWGANISNIPANAEYISYHGSVIVSIVLTQNHPYYGQVGDDILSVGLQEAIDNGDPYWNIYE